MAGVEGVPTIRTLDEWNEFVQTDQKTPALLQSGTPACVRCAPFTARINQLKQAYSFRHAYVNHHDAEEDLIEELGVTMVPAFRIVLPKDPDNATSMQNATPEELTKAIQETCPTALSFEDDDF